MRYRALAVGIATLVGAATLTSCEEGSTISRGDEAQVLTGAQLPAFTNPSSPVAPSTIVGFAYVTVDGVPQWRQIPVQVDERKVTPFGQANDGMPNVPHGIEGTVYGTPSDGHTALQYTDPSTWVGPDTNTNFDGDDELVFMVADAGGERPSGTADPVGVVTGSGVRVALTDPLDPADAGWVYLFRSAGGLAPGANKDYVDYDFNLVSGNYRGTYDIDDGPNLETSKVTTAVYEIGFTDRWMETSWRSLDPTATGIDFLDGAKTQFGVLLDSGKRGANCFRGNGSFADREGAFIANIDGPVRGIRAYIGANSGAWTQRTHVMYRQHEEVVTDLRVHSLGGEAVLADFADFSPAATGMTYRSSTVPAGVAIDGIADSVPTAPPTWEVVSGPHGTVLTAAEFDTENLPGFNAGIQWVYIDQTPSEAACPGGDDLGVLGGAGPKLNSYGSAGFPNSDPRLVGATPTVPLAKLRAIRTNVFTGPPSDVSLIDDVGDAWAVQVRTPLTVTVSPA